MRTSNFELSTAFIVGPPGAGKTTIGREAASRIQAAFHTIDDWAGVVYPPSARSKPMTDSQVDQAISLLFDAVGPTAAVCEFAHHDYVALMANDRYPVFTTSRKVIVLADLDICNARNKARKSPVNAEYVERVWRSANDLIAFCNTQHCSQTLIIDTTATPIANALAMTVSFLNEE